MIDIEFDVFDAVADRLREQYPGIFITGDVSFSPARFPAVSVVETGNSVVSNMRTSVIENAFQKKLVSEGTDDFLYIHTILSDAERPMILYNDRILHT